MDFAPLTWTARAVSIAIQPPVTASPVWRTTTATVVSSATARVLAFLFLAPPIVIADADCFAILHPVPATRPTA